MKNELFGNYYLGDGVYATYEHDMIKLTTSDGETTTNVIYLEEQVWESLLRYAAQLGWSA